MKKYILIVLFLLFAVLLYRSVPAYAVSLEKKSEYVLPYPGMLADNPLYFLKKLRDKILENLIADPTRKIEFYILQSDKELSAGVLMGSKDKQELVGESFTQAGAYMEQAVKRAGDLKSQGKDMSSIVDRLGNSLGKHEELLNDFVSKATEAQKVNLKSDQELVKKLQADVTAIQ